MKLGYCPQCEVRMMPDESGRCRVCSGVIEEAPKIRTAPTPAQRAAAESPPAREFRSNDIARMGLGIIVTGCSFLARLLLPCYILFVITADVLTGGNWLSLVVVQRLIWLIGCLVAFGLVGQAMLIPLPCPANAKSSQYGAAAFQFVGLASYATTFWINGSVSVAVQVGCAFFVMMGQILLLTFLRDYHHARGNIALSNDAAGLCRSGVGLSIAFFFTGVIVTYLVNSILISMVVALFGLIVVAAVLFVEFSFFRKTAGLLASTARSLASLNSNRTT